MERLLRLGSGGIPGVGQVIVTVFQVKIRHVSSVVIRQTFIDTIIHRYNVDIVNSMDSGNLFSY